MFLLSIQSYKYIYVTFSFSLIQPVIGTLAKFPKWLPYFYFSIGNLWAIMEISISAWSSFKSTLITYLVLIVGY